MHLTAVFGQGILLLMKKRSDSQNILTEASAHTAERLIWFTARKDQSAIAQGIAAGKDLEEVYGLGDAELFDEFFGFLAGCLSSGRFRLSFSNPSR